MKVLAAMSAKEPRLIPHIALRAGLTTVQVRSAIWELLNANGYIQSYVNREGQDLGWMLTKDPGLF